MTPKKLSYFRCLFPEIIFRKINELNIGRICEDATFDSSN